MSEPTPTGDPVEAIESALRAVDASLSVLVIARENLVNALRTIAAPPAKDPYQTMGQTPDPGCQHDKDGHQVLAAPGGRGVCDGCGEDIPWAG